jgi:hypothetical protein
MDLKTESAGSAAPYTHQVQSANLSDYAAVKKALLPPNGGPENQSVPGRVQSNNAWLKSPVSLWLMAWTTEQKSEPWRKTAANQNYG